MNYNEFVAELGNARKLINEFQSRVLDIVRYIKTRVDKPLNMNGWNRRGYYVNDSLNILKFDAPNYHEYRIFEHEVISMDKDKAEGVIALDILQVMEIEGNGVPKQCRPTLIFMFSFKKSDVPDWPSWPNSRDNDWIKETIKNGDSMLFSFNSGPSSEKTNDSVFISNAVSIERLKSEKEIDDELQKLNEIYKETIATGFNCSINPIFNINRQEYKQAR